MEEALFKLYRRSLKNGPQTGANFGECGRSLTKSKGVAAGDLRNDRAALFDVEKDRRVGVRSGLRRAA